MDAEKGRESRKDGSNTFRVQIRYTKTISMGALEGYLNQQRSFDNDVLEAISMC